MKQQPVLSKILPLIAFFCLAIGQPETSFGQPGICELLFQSSPTKVKTFFTSVDRTLKIRSIDKNIKDDVINSWKKEFDISDKPTVQAQLLPNYNGELAILKKSILSPWASSSSSLKGQEDIQGSPTVNFRVMGKYTTFSLDFRAVDKNTMIVPTAKRYSENIKKLSEELIRLGYEPIPFHFYEQSELSISQYAKTFKSNFGLPVADIKSPIHFVHDIAFHYTSILMPPAYARLLQQRIGLLNDLIEYLKSQKDIPAQNHLLQFYLQKLSLHRARTIDFATAAMGTILLYKEHQAENKDHEYTTFRTQQQFLRSIFTFSVDPYLFLTSRITQPHFYNKEGKLIYSKEESILEGKINDFFKEPEILNRYSEIANPSHPLRSTSQLTEAIYKRKAELEEASLELLIKKTK